VGAGPLHLAPWNVARREDGPPGLIVPVMMQRDGIAGELRNRYDSIRAGVAHDRSSFYKELSAPFFGAIAKFDRNARHA